MSSESSRTLGRTAPAGSSSFSNREIHYRRLLDTLHERAETVKLGGGLKRIEREHTRGKMTARERIAGLLDDPSDFMELGLFAGDGLYDDEGGLLMARRSEKKKNEDSST